MNNEPDRLRYGVVAQDVDKIASELVYKGNTMSVGYIDLLVAKIARLEQRLNKLENGC